MTANELASLKEFLLHFDRPFRVVTPGTYAKDDGLTILFVAAGVLAERLTNDLVELFEDGHLEECYVALCPACLKARHAEVAAFPRELPTGRGCPHCPNHVHCPDVVVAYRKAVKTARPGRRSRRSSLATEALEASA